MRHPRLEGATAALTATTHPGGALCAPITSQKAAIEALVASDYAPVQGFVLTMALLYVLLNLAIDLVYGFVDPRVRLSA